MPIGFANPVAVFSSTVVAMLDSFAAQLLLQPRHFKGADEWIFPAAGRSSEDGKALTRTYKFADFSEAFAFLTRVALHAEKVDHHPEFTSVWNRVDFRLTSHDAGGVTERDFKLAEAINALAAS